MQFINPIFLITKTYKENKISDNGTIQESERKVLSSISSVKQSEFYQAQVSGLKPEIVFKIRSFEYKGEDLLLYNNNKYVIIRSYNSLDGITELVCTKKLGDING